MRFDRIDTPAEHEAAQRRLCHLAFVERRHWTDAERVELQESIHDYEMRRVQQERAA